MYFLAYVWNEETWNPSLHIIVFQVDQWHTVIITQVVSLNSCDLFPSILVASMK